MLNCRVSARSDGEADSSSRENVPLLAGTLHVLISTPDHDQVHAGHIDPWLETASGDIPLEIGRQSVSIICCGMRAGLPGSALHLMWQFENLPCTELGRSPQLGAYPEA